MKRHGWRALVLVLAAVVMYLRAPVLFREPRIWAEEGTVYLTYAYSHPWGQALLSPHQGYYSLYPNLVTVLAVQWLDILHWPTLTTWAAFAVQLLPIGLILWGESRLWEHDVKRLLGALLVLFTLSSAEVWLNTINSQFYWALVAFLVLMDDPPSVGARAWVYRVLLAVAALTGPVTSFLLPVFVYRAWRDRAQREAVVQAGITLLGAVVQGGVMLLGDSNVPAAARWASLDLPSLGAILWNRTVVVPFLGIGAASNVAEALVSLREQDPAQMVLIGVGLLLLLGALLAFLATKDARIQAPMVASYLLVSVLSTVAAIVAPGDPKFVLVDPGSAIRYFYVPSVFLGLLALSGTSLSRAAMLRVRSLAGVSLVLLALFFGVQSYRDTIRPFVNPFWGRWHLEVTRFRRDRETELRIWPQNWKMQLPPKAQ